MYRWVKKTAVNNGLINPTAFDLREHRNEKYISVNSQELGATLLGCQSNYPQNTKIISLLVENIIGKCEGRLKKKSALYHIGFPRTHCGIYHNKYGEEITNHNAEYLTYKQTLARVSIVEK